MSSNNLCRKMEAVLQGYLTPYLTGNVTIIKAMEIVSENGLPDDRIEVLCATSRPLTNTLDATSGLTNRYIGCMVAVQTRAAVLRDDQQIQIGDVRDRHDQHVGAMMDALYVDGLVTELNGIGIAGIKVEQVDWPNETTSIAPPHGFRTELTFDVLAHSVA